MSIKEKIKSFVGISALDTIYKALTFHDLFFAASPLIESLKVKRVRQRRSKAIAKMQSKKEYNVIFMLQSPAVWKYDTLYRMMEASEIFHPTVVVSPFNVHLVYNMAECFKVMRQAEAFCERMGYRYISSYDFEKKRWLDVKKILKPDIVFFTKPYKDTLPKYHIYHFLECLTLYVPYGYLCIDNYRTSYNLPFHNLLWHFLVETEFHKQYSEQYALCKGDNTIVIGALGVENLMLADYQPKDVWKPQVKRKKRIIWAPHHTVDYMFNFSNFLVYCEEMFRIAEKYKEEIQIAFKPHPVLKFKLIKIWGEEKTEAYYKRWAELENGQIAEGDYIDLFKTSDALIHDCASFTAEYLYTNRPLLFMVRDENVEKHLNSFGKMCFGQHYHAMDIEEIEHFIEDVVINGNDTMKPRRDEFYKEYLYPKDGVMPSQKIFNLLTETLGK